MQHSTPFSRLRVIDDEQLVGPLRRPHTIGGQSQGMDERGRLSHPHGQNVKRTRQKLKAPVDPLPEEPMITKEKLLESELDDDLVVSLDVVEQRGIEGLLDYEANPEKESRIPSPPTKGLDDLSLEQETDQEESMVTEEKSVKALVTDGLRSLTPLESHATLGGETSVIPPEPVPIPEAVISPKTFIVPVSSDLRTGQSCGGESYVSRKRPTRRGGRKNKKRPKEESRHQKDDYVSGNILFGEKDSMSEAESPLRKAARPPEFPFGPTSSVGVRLKLASNVVKPTLSKTTAVLGNTEERPARTRVETVDEERNRRFPIKRKGIFFSNLTEIPTNPVLDPPPYACYNCWQRGHVDKVCPRLRVRIYCSNCGRTGVKVMACPRCKDKYDYYVSRRDERAADKGVRQKLAKPAGSTSSGDMGPVKSRLSLPETQPSRNTLKGPKEDLRAVINREKAKCEDGRMSMAAVVSSNIEPREPLRRVQVTSAVSFASSVPVRSVASVSRLASGASTVSTAVGPTPAPRASRPVSTSGERLTREPASTWSSVPSSQEARIQLFRETFDMLRECPTDLRNRILGKLFPPTE